MVELFENKNLEITRRNKSSNLMIYFIKNISINNKKLKLLKSEDIIRLNNIFQLKTNFLSVNSISNILNIDVDEDKKLINCDDDNVDNSSNQIWKKIIITMKKL